MFEVESQSTRPQSVTVFKVKKKQAAEESVTIAEEGLEREGSLRPSRKGQKNNNCGNIGVLKGRPVIMETLTEW